MKYTLSEEQIKRFSGILFLTALAFLLIRYSLGRVEDVGNVIVYFTLGSFLFGYLFTGKSLSGHTTARILIATVWVALTLICVLSEGLKMPVLVLYPMIPVMALVMSGKRTAMITSVIAIVTLLALAGLEISPYEFRPATISESSILVMRSFWLIFMLIILVIIGRFYTDKIEELTSALQGLADTDYLTGLASRKKLRESLEREFNRAMRHNKQLSLLLIDVDHFKQLNQTAGMVMGDECLKLIAGAIVENCKRSTDISGRFGGDEFMVILPDTSHEDAIKRGQQINRSVESLQIHLNLSDNTLVSLTVGCVTTSDLKSTNIEKLISTANDLILKGKAGGGNQIMDTVV